MKILQDVLQPLKSLFFENEEGIRRSDLETMLTRQPISEFILAAAYDEDTSSYIMRDDTVGFIFEAFPKTIIGEETIRSLQEIMTSPFLPAGSVVQVTMWADPNLAPFIERFKDIRKKQNGEYIDEAAEFWTTTMAEFLEGHTQKGPFEASMAVPFRNFRLFFSFKLPYSYDNFEEKKHAVLTAIRSIRTTLETSSFFPTTVAPDRYIQILSQIYNPKHQPTPPLYDPHEYIYKQVIQADTEVEIGKRCIKYDGVFGKAMTIKQYPEEVSVLDTVHFIGNLYRNELQLTCPFILTLNCYIQNDALKNAQHQKAEFLYKQQSASSLSIVLERKQEEARYCLEKVSEGHKYVRGSLMWWFYHEDMEVLTKSTQTLTNLLLMKEYKVQEEIRNVNLALLWASTPMNASYEMEDKLLKRWRPMFEFNAAHMSPIQADWKGTGTPVAPFVSIRGQLQNIDLFDGPEGYNVCIAAMTGKGKSFLINHFISAYRTLPQVSNIWIVDVGDSYKPWCESVGGMYIDLNDKDDIVLNPFSECDDLNADMDLFVRLVAKMAKPSEECNDTEKSIIEESIKRTFAKHGKSTNIDKLIDMLNEMNDETPDQMVKKNAIATIVTNLFRWSTGGVYGKYFNGANNIDLSSRVVVLELKNLTQREDLKNVILMVLFYHIHRVVYLENDLGKRKLLVFDEAWQHMNDEKVAAFIERAYRTFRKCGSSAITVTQGVSDYYQNNSTKQMFFQAAYKFLLGQTQESIDLLRKEAQLSFSEHDFELLSRLKTIRGHYSEMFVVSPFGRGPARLVVPGPLYWLYTTDADDAAKRKELTDQYGFKEGIKKCVELYSK